MGNLFIFFMIVTKSLQSTNVKEEKYCECYDRCQRNFTVNATIHEQSKAACERGCRFYSLVLHSNRDADPTAEKAKAKEKCETSCTQSYVNSTEVAACNFGCSSMKLTDGDVCGVTEQNPQDVIEFVFDDSSAIIHLEEPELDDVLIDIALRKQLEASYGNNRDVKQKLPEITFKNLPITKVEHAGSPAIRCPRFYELYVKLALRHRKLTSGDLYFVGSILIVAIVFFAVNRYLEKHRKLWKQIFINIIQDGNKIMKVEETILADDILLIDCIPRKEGVDGFQNSEVEDLKNPIRADFEDVTLVYYENDNSRSQTKLSQNKF